MEVMDIMLTNEIEDSERKKTTIEEHKDNGEESTRLLLRYRMNYRKKRNIELEKLERTTRMRESTRPILSPPPSSITMSSPRHPSEQSCRRVVSANG